VTREEAIGFGKMWLDINSDAKDSLTYEFFEQALETLKAEPCEDVVSREFQELIVEYPPAEICTYPEYRGKPYYSIKYRENGQEFVGYGTYKPDVMSRYLKDYFIKLPVSPKPTECEDAVSREALLKLTEEYADTDAIKAKYVRQWITDLPSVTPALSEIRAEIMAIGNWRRKSEIPNGYLVQAIEIIDRHIEGSKPE